MTALMTGDAAAASGGGSRTVADVIGVALARLGAGHCFGVVGSGNFHVTNALRASGVPFTATRHEAGAATMADAFSRMSGTVGLVSVHQGCGLTNAATGIGEAAKSRTPLLVLAAEASAAAVGSNFAMDQPGFAHAVTAESHRVHSADSVLADVSRAFHAARDERRTVVLNLPIDVQEHPVSGETWAAAATLSPQPVPERPTASPAAVRALADFIESAERPVLIAGRGAREAGAELRALGAASGALLATSAVANGLFHGDPFDLGISGGFSSPLTADLITGADLIVSFGCALNMWTMRHGRLIGSRTRVVQVDLEAAALGATRPIDLGILGDVAGTAEALTAELTHRGTADRAGYRSHEIADRIAAESRWHQVPLDAVAAPTQNATAEPGIDPREASTLLNELLPRERIVSIDSGNFMGYPSAYLDVPDEFGFCFTQAFQSIGLGLATAIGSAIARPDRLPVLGTGDGGFLMAIAELETAVRLALPLLIAVYNDDAYGAEVHHFASAAADLDTVTFSRVDIARIAQGFGAQGATVTSPDDLAVVREWLASDPRTPLVLDLRITSDGGAWWLAEAFAGH